MAAENGQPRRHHYEFAHRALRSIMSDPKIDLVRLANDQGRLDGALRATWGEVGARHAENDRVSEDGLSVERRSVSGFDGLLVTLPTALNPAEAIFVLVVPLESPEARRLLALEFVWDVVNRRPYTVLGAWTQEGHINLGDRPKTDPDAFIEADSAVL